mmetsp:Transcript_79782/g.222075  ORF Transcript_79782/g.222075 Transcript_79782/m.222075 type:complete len:281 (+) Transcript_79782:185-1027(+)
MRSVAMDLQTIEGRYFHFGRSPSDAAIIRRLIVGKRISEPSSAFKQRQAGCRSCVVRRDAATGQLQDLQEFRTERDAYFLGAQGLDGFRAFLAKRCGSISNGWRELDATQKGWLCFNEFCVASRALGFSGNLKGVWDKLNADGLGKVTLRDLDPEAAAALERPKAEVTRDHASDLTACSRLFDASGSNKTEDPDADASCHSRFGAFLDETALAPRSFRPSSAPAGGRPRSAASSESETRIKIRQTAPVRLCSRCLRFRKKCICPADVATIFPARLPLAGA